MILNFIKKREKYKITKEKEIKLEKELKELKEKLIDAKNRMEESRMNDSDEDSSMLGIVGEERESIEGKISEIENILKNYTIIADKDICEPDKIVLGSEIKVKEADKVQKYRIVTPIEADPLKNYISNESPLGKKLLKAKLGDKVNIKVRDNTITYEILEVC